MVHDRQMGRNMNGELQVTLFKDPNAFRNMDLPANIIQAGAFEAKFVAMRQVQTMT